MKPALTGITRLIAATKHSIQGLQAAWINESAFRQEAVLCLVGIPAAIWLATSPIQLALLISALLLLMVVELLNSAIEAAIDRIGPERHELSGRAKDLGSAAVLLALTLAATIWSAVAWERFAN